MCTELNEDGSAKMWEIGDKEEWLDGTE
jgi:hypothetical protein